MSFYCASSQTLTFLVLQQQLSLTYNLPPSPETLPYLFHALFVLDEGLAPLILKLIYSALSGTPPAKEEGATPEAEPEARTYASRSSRRKELEEHKKAKEKGKETKAVVVVGKWFVDRQGLDGL